MAVGMQGKMNSRHTGEKADEDPAPPRVINKFWQLYRKERWCLFLLTTVPRTWKVLNSC